MRYGRLWFVATLVTLALACSARADADFAFQNGDVVVFLGDSNTAAGGYMEVSEIYSLLRFPTRDITFIRSGVGSETSVGGAARLPGVLDQNPGATALVVTYGINDIVPCLRVEGTSIIIDQPCFETASSAFITAMNQIITTAQARGVRVYLSSYPLLGSGPDVNAKLATLELYALYIAAARGEYGINVHAKMQAVVGTTPPADLYAAQDFVPGVHLSDRGHNLWAFALLQGLGAPPQVSSVTVNAATLTGSATGATVTNIAGSTSLVTFTRTDAGLPISFGSPAAWWGLAAFPWHTISDYQLKVTNLQPGTYEIRVAGRLLGTATHTVLAAGRHIANMQPNFWNEAGPWVVQGTAVRQMVSGRTAIASGHAWGRQLAASNPNQGDIDELNDAAQPALRDLLRASAAPYPYAFEVRRVP